MELLRALNENALKNLVQMHGTWYVLNNLFYYEVGTRCVLWDVTNTCALYIRFENRKRVSSVTKYQEKVVSGLEGQGG